MMLGLLLIYFIGKYYFKLAELYSKKRWFYAIVGVLFYYGGTFIAGIILGTISELTKTYFMDDLDYLALGLIALPFGLLSTTLFYQYLKHYWKGEYGEPKTDYYRD